MLARHHFAVTGLWIDRDALGSSHEVLAEGHRCRLYFPARRMDFDLDQYRPVPDEVAIGGYVGEATAMQKASVLMLRVEVEMDGDLTADQMPSGQTPDKAVMDAAYEIMQKSADIARRLVAAVTNWIRVEADQFWLEPQQNLPRVTWLSHLFDADGRRLAIGYNDPVTIFGVDAHQKSVTAKIASELLARAAQNPVPPVPEALLADARFYAWRAAQPNPRLGLILAAVACESKIKSVLTDSAQAEQADLINLVLDNPRDVSVSAVSLFDKGLKAVLGISMREEAKELYKSVIVLFEHRNRFAHRGDLDLDEAEIRADLVAATKAFAWLDDLQDRIGNTPQHT